MIRTPRTTRPFAALALVAALLAGCAGTGVAPASSGVPSSSPSASTPASAAAGACPTSQPEPLPAGQTRTVTIATSQGTIVITVDGTLSPIAAGNFVALAQCGYYTGVVFHRLVPGFVIQGGDGQYGRISGDVSQAGQGGPGYTIKDEPVTTTYKRGTVAMARTNAPDSQGSQFFIVLDDAASVPLAAYNTYAIFGTVTSGMETVDAIAAMPNSGEPSNTALQPVAMDTVTVGQP